MSAAQHGSTPVAIGTSIAHYRVLSQLGSGGMGDVYRAHDVKLNRDIAIKVLRGPWTTDEEVAGDRRRARASRRRTRLDALKCTSSLTRELARVSKSR